MTEITKQNLDEFVLTGEFDIDFSVKPEAGSLEKKSGTLRFKMDKVALKDVIQSSLKDKRINEQVKMRAHFESIPDKGIYEASYSGGRGPKEDAEVIVANRAKAAGMSIEEYVISQLKARGIK